MTYAETTKASENLPLFVRLCERIKFHGAITFHDWMDAALYEKPDGYYVRNDKERWGRAGDYRTASEISSLFAATFAGYFARLFKELNSPEEFTIVEYGAGSGSFALGVLITLQRQFPSVFDATKYLIEEISESSKLKIEERLSDFSNRFSFYRSSEISGSLQNVIIFSNELIDAFPVHRVAMREDTLKEIYVDVDDTDNFVLVEDKPVSDSINDYIQKNKIELKENQIIEINLAADKWIKQVAMNIENGFIVTVDYGADAETLYDFNSYPEGTLRAFSKHQFVDDLLSHIGDVDLTTTVNWTAFQLEGNENKLQTISLESLDKFLLRIGLLEQLEIGTDNATNEIEKIQLRTSIKDLILPNSLGSSQQVLVQKKS